MALTDDNGIGATMLVTPTGNNFGGYPVMPYMPYGQQNSGGMFGGDSWLGILFLIALCNGGFGFGGFGGAGAMMGAGMFGMDMLYPWLNNSQNINDGFREQQLSTQVGGIQSAVTSGFGDVQTALCGGFAGVNASINGAQNAIAQQLYSNQLADLERSFAAQTANTQGMTALSSQLAQCCCDNRLATESLRATVVQENCQDRYEAQTNTRDVIQAITAGIQSIKDDLCADRLDAERRENANLRSELMYARGEASRVAQSGDIVNSIYNRLSTCPVGTTPVFGNQPIFTCNSGCNNNSGCGCGSF